MITARIKIIPVYRDYRSCFVSHETASVSFECTSNFHFILHAVSLRFKAALMSQKLFQFSETKTCWMHLHDLIPPFASSAEINQDHVELQVEMKLEAQNSFAERNAQSGRWMRCVTQSDCHGPRGRARRQRHGGIHSWRSIRHTGNPSKLPGEEKTEKADSSSSSNSDLSFRLSAQKSCKEESKSPVRGPLPAPRGRSRGEWEHDRSSTVSHELERM